ncbi:UDP-glucose 6-dehydrogenase [Candidatus Gottesmanbacteria bacterium RIFCSPHIGHO2_02_FULL_39_14]|uniref:UDP-glucose 6-dehydrogenase n=2 Tax=Candidatus Gottesmaniibacteriota TaxID=1752720 RepID=A0A1F5ZWH4_9BACT|nr:MAG: UDP-glucose 6-dehydrogenase [Candidatus Gottesmanbacteria bacterium RIFCSPHIGHO2_02_FULL_39_14]OGG31422.1 MAG: UDP-glucose 6-dehydrogenase [Candidatus Gottesmanbacteria bacterium RIFCSPLOWO2_02_FULL_38_8]
MTIAFVGHGYVGLVTAAVFADLGNTVWVIGRTREKIDNLNKGITPFYEPGLEEMVKRNHQSGRLKFTLNYNEAVSQSKVIFICVGTPSKNNGEADLSDVFKASRLIGKYLKNYAVVVTKSTVPVGINRQVAKIIKEVKADKVTFDIASCPEFLREGTAVSDTLNPDRIVIGVDSKTVRDILLDLHKPIMGERVITTIETAEMIKYASNALLATKISFANALSFICDKVGADVEMVLNGVGLDKRLGRTFLYPGVGFGGSCFPKDVKALIAVAKKKGYDFKLLKAVYQINEDAKKSFVDKVEKTLSGVEGKTLGVWGLSFKANTDDMRQAPSIDIINMLQKKGARIKAFDPVAMENASRILTNVVFTASPSQAAEGADALLILTEWNEFKQLDLKGIKKVMKKNFLFDGRNIYELEKVKNLGFIYKGIGRE